jgi:hypothetical protein
MKVERIEVTLEGLRQLRGRIEHQQLDADDWSLVGALVGQLIGRVEARQARMLAKLAAGDAAQATAASDRGIDAESAPAALTCSDSTSSSEDSATDNAVAPESCDSGPTDGVVGSTGTPEPNKRKGHGRNGAGAYTSATHHFHALALSVIGMLCEACGAGRMGRYREKRVIRIVGQPLFAGEIHHFEQARCKICGRIIRASGPACVLEGVGSSYVTYDWSACAMLIVMHYFGGAPFKRLESLHAGWGVPLPDANQWQVVDASDDLLLPLYKAIERHGIEQAISIRIDDTGSMVITLQRQIQAEVAALKLVGESTNDVRTGINATGVYLETDNETVVLFFTGRHHAGEILDQLLQHRTSSSDKLVKVTDGASKNFDHAHADELIEASCNAHALLKFRDLKNKYPAEYATAGEIYKKVFDNDDQAKALGLTALERMLYHQQRSLPLMNQLKAMCKQKIESKLVEPCSPLWQPCSFIINQWSRLTRFCHEPGVPLDTNLVEQTLIIPVRYLAGSFNYQTENGAVVGDHHMSLVATARKNGVEPVAYLADCLRHHEDLAKRPEYYLPWVYRQRRENADARSSPARQSAPICAAADDEDRQRPGDLQATLRHRSGKSQFAGSPPQIST